MFKLHHLNEYFMERVTLIQWSYIIHLFCFVNGYLSDTTGIPLQYEECETGTSLISGSSVTYPDYSRNIEMPTMVPLEDPAGVWRAFDRSTQQFLVVDLKSVHIVTQVRTWGRTKKNEYVREYAIEYSIDYKAWMEYMDEYGLLVIFKGNNESESVAENTLKYPIIARYLKFKVINFFRSISMKVDLVGCPYASEVIYTSNGGHIVYDASDPPYNATYMIKLRFRSTRENGILFYAVRDSEFNDIMLLELRKGELHLKIDIASSTSSLGKTDVIGGRFLNDGLWHDVIFFRNGSNAKLIIDHRVIDVMMNHRVFRLKPSGKIFIGGINNLNSRGLSVNSENFRGCIDRFRYNDINVIRNAKKRLPGYLPVGPVAFTCSMELDDCLLFTANTSNLVYDVPATSDIRLEFEFKTIDKNATIFRIHEEDNWGVKFGKNVSSALETDWEGNLFYTVTYKRGGVFTDTVKKVTLEGRFREYTDGLWHTFNMRVNKTSINVTVDGFTRMTNKEMDIPSSQMKLLFGTDEISSVSFIGCLRNINIGAMPGENQQFRHHALVATGPCVIKDRCTPNPCEHNGKCIQDADTYLCDCGSTGYTGAFCHISPHPLSCAVYYSMSVNPPEPKKDITVDPDGSGPIDPFIVDCGYVDSLTNVETSLSHDAMEPVIVDGYQEPNYYSRKIRYTTDVEGLSEVIERSVSCKQGILWRCNNSRLMARAIDSFSKTYAYWVGRTNQEMFYWGGSAPGTYKCECGVSDRSQCIMGSSTCNCDSNEIGTEDGGFITQKQYLPVMELYFGDTGTLTDNKIGEYTLGKLSCHGESLFDNTVTFRKEDSTLEFAPFNAVTAGDIWFQFKTTANDGVIIHNIGVTNETFIKIELKGGFLELSYNTGNGILKIESGKYVSNDTWHTVHVERNLKQAFMRVDNLETAFVDEPSDKIPRRLELTNPLVVGATVDYKNGFVGCVRGLMVNGELKDMGGAVKNGKFTYGVQEGCVRKCTSSPCFNGGKCIEGYSHYTCDCTNTPLMGKFCSKEVGVNMGINYMIRYEISNLSQYSSLTQNQLTNLLDLDLKVGFITKRKQGILLQLNGEEGYISLEINNNGGVKLFLDAAFERWEINTPIINIDYTNGQPHMVTVRQKERFIHIQVDDYPEAYGEAYIFPSNFKYMYIGNNNTFNSWNGFQGCIYHVQIGDLFPLKTAFEVPKPDYVTFIPNGVMQESTCELEEVTHSPEPVEVRVVPLEEIPTPTCVRPVPSPVNDRGGKHLEDGDLFFTFPRQDIVLNENSTGLLSMTCRVTSPKIDDVNYILIRQETSPGSGEFECLAMIDLSDTQVPELHDHLKSNKTYVVTGTLNKTMATYPYLSVGIDVLNLTCGDAKEYMCEVSYKNSSSGAFETASTIGTILAEAGCEIQEKQVDENSDDESMDTKTQVGIALGVIGGVLLVLVIAFVVYQYRKRTEDPALDNEANGEYSATFSTKPTE